MLYDPNKGKYVKSNHEHVKKFTGVWERGYKRKWLKGKNGRYHLRKYDDGREMVSFQWYDHQKKRVTNTILIGEWEDVRNYHWFDGRRQGKRKVPAQDPFELG